MQAQTGLLRIMVIASRFPLRSETFVLDQVLRLSRRGHHVQVLCARRGDFSVLDPDDQSALKAVQIICWPDVPNWVRRVLPRRLHQFLAHRRNRRMFLRLKADVGVAHFGWTGARFAGFMEEVRSGPPLITIYHGRDVGAEWQENGLSGYRGLFRLGARHLPVNAVFARLLVQAGAPAERVFPLHIGVPVDEYAFRPPRRGPGLHLVSVCRLVEKKGIDIGLQALARLSAEQPDLNWRYDIGGEGPQEESLRVLVSGLGLENRVRFVGPLRHEQSLALLRDADVLLQPSITADDGDQEGIPVILMEAMAIGTIACTTRHSGIPELVEHGVSGLLSDERDAAGLAGNLSRIARGDVDLAIMAAAARRKIEADFNADTQIGLLERHCLAVLGRDVEKTVNSRVQTGMDHDES